MIIFDCQEGKPIGGKNFFDFFPMFKHKID
jgi:hypothetical protein